jgi:protein-disulfide isomerase
MRRTWREVRDVKGMLPASLVLAVILSGSTSAAEQGFPWARVPEVRAGDFKPEFLASVARRLETLPCYGRCQRSVAECLRAEPPHPTAARLARDALLLLGQGASDEDLIAWTEKRRAMAHPRPEDVRVIRIERLTPLGAPDAPVVVVEYSDFECPFCRQVAPMIEEIVRSRPGRARLYLKQFPLKGHPHSLSAAQACVAADGFGKFWEYCGALWHMSGALSEENLIRRAESEGMAPAAFQAAMQSEAVLDRIADEKVEGLRLRIKGTPTLYINGKELLLQPTAQLLKDRIDEEWDILQGRD